MGYQVPSFHRHPQSAGVWSPLRAVARRPVEELRFRSLSGPTPATIHARWIFSGVFLSNERFPAALQPFVQALPLTALNEALRAVMLEGASLVALAPELAILGWGPIGFAGALELFRWS